MQSQWITRSDGLPQEGQPVEFVLDDREVALGGTYNERTFQSRWSGYQIDRVRAWRSRDSDGLIGHGEGDTDPSWR